MNQDSKQFTPLLFVSDRNIGFISFMECFEAWELEAEKDPELDLMHVFGLKWSLLNESPVGPPVRRPGLDKNNQKIH